MSEHSRQVIEGAFQSLADHEQVEEHPEHAAALITLNNLFDLEPFAAMWERICQVDRDEITMTLADGIQRRATVRERQLLLKVASDI